MTDKEPLVQALIRATIRCQCANAAVLEAKREQDAAYEEWKRANYLYQQAKEADDEADE